MASLPRLEISRIEDLLCWLVASIYAFSMSTFGLEPTQIQ